MTNRTPMLPWYSMVEMVLSDKGQSLTKIAFEAQAV